MTESIETSSVQAAVLERRTHISLWRRWTSFGSGIGIAIEPGRLEVVLVEVRPQAIRVVDTLEILRYRERPASEWGAEYEAFLEKHKIKHLAAVAVLPSKDVVARVASVAGAKDNELEAAVRYQLDGLHPYPEEEIKFSFARLRAPERDRVAIAIAREAVINEYATFLEEGGVELASLVTPAAAYYSALRILQDPPQDRFLAVREKENAVEIYAETETHPLYFVELEQESSRAVAFAASQVRLPREESVQRIAALLPVAESSLVYGPCAFAAALMSAVPRQALGVNLLPVERRRVISPWRWVPTLVLLGLCILVGLALAYFQEFQQRDLLRRIEAENAKLAGTLSQVRQADATRDAARKRIEQLQDFARIPKDDLDTLRELTRVVPPSAWVSRLDMSRTHVTMMGEVETATEMLRILDDSPLLSNSEFLAQVGRSANNREIFQIRAQRERPKPGIPAPAAVPAAGATPNPGVTK